MMVYSNLSFSVTMRSNSILPTSLFTNFSGLPLPAFNYPIHDRPTVLSNSSRIRFISESARSFTTGVTTFLISTLCIVSVMLKLVNSLPITSATARWRSRSCLAKELLFFVSNREIVQVNLFASQSEMPRCVAPTVFTTSLAPLHRYSRVRQHTCGRFVRLYHLGLLH
jgi:hypothetical protein